MSYDSLKLNRQGCFRLYTAARLMMQAYQPMLAPMGITYTQYLVMMVLWEQDAQPLNAISRSLFLESNTLTPVIKRMEAMKLVARKRSKNDARQTIVTLTEHGRALEHQAASVPECMASQLTKNGFDAEGFQAVNLQLDRLIEILSKE